MSEDKCVLIIDETLPVGIIANTAAVLSISLGKVRPEMVGRDLEDHEGRQSNGITTMAIPILKGNGSLLKEMRKKVRGFEPELKVIELIGATMTTKSYEEYALAMKDTPEQQQEYLGLALSGTKKIVNKFTGNLGLLR
jgi:hypothetical protein